MHLCEIFQLFFGYLMHFGQIQAIIFLPEIIPAPTQASAQEGIMLLLRSGSDISITDAWENSSLSNPTTDSNKHSWSVQEIIEVGGNFRSPIIDQLNQSTLTEIVLRLYNKNGARIKEFFLQPGPTNTVYDLAPLRFPWTKIIHGDNPAMAIVRANNTNKVAFFQYSHGPRDNLTLSGQQFLFSTDNDQRRTPVFPTAGYQGCFEISFNVNFKLNDGILNVHECTSICLGASSSSFAIAPNSDNFSCVCLSSDGYNIIDVGPVYCEMFCDDGLSCGGRYYGGSILFASVYTLAPVLNVLERISNETARSTAKKDTHVSADIPWVSFDDSVYITGIEVSEPHVNHGLYGLSYSGLSCDNATSWVHVAELTGNSKSFDVNTFHKLQPIPARCLNISMDEFQKTYYYVSVEYVTEDFMFAPYLAVYVKWSDPSESTTSTYSTSFSPVQPSPLPPNCQLTDLMSHHDVIPSDNVTITYQQVKTSLESFASTTRYVPSIATDVLTAEFLNNPEFWVDEISVWSNQEFSTRMYMNTSQTCTNQNTGGDMFVMAEYTVSGDDVTADATFTYDLAYLKESLRLYCVSFIVIETWVRQAPDNPSSFALETSVMGCKNNRGQKTIDTCSIIDLLRVVEMESRVSVKWRQDQSNAYTNSYTHGQRFQLPARANPSVSISPASSTILLKHISVEGNVFLVTVLTDKTSASISKQSTSDTTVTVDFGGAIETSRVFIVPYSADNATDGLYNFTIQLIGCIPESKISTTPPAIQTSSVSSTAPIESTSPTAGSDLISSPTETTSSPSVSSETTDSLVATNTSPRSGAAADSICCSSYCQSNVSITQEETEMRIAALVAELTIPRHNVSAHRRRKESAKDGRTSAVAMGTCCGVIVLTMSGVFILIMDFDHVVAMFRFIRTVLKRV